MELLSADLVKKIDRRYWIAFVSAMVVGIISHGMGIFNKFSVHDDALYMFDVGATYGSGQWMLGIFDSVFGKFFGDGHVSLPVINGFVSLVCIAVSSCIVIKLLGIKNDVLCSFIGAIMVCFPVVTSIFGYMFTAHYYFIAMLMEIAGVYVVCRYNRWWTYVIGILLMCSSVGVYQAFIPVGISLMLLWYINYLYSFDNVKLMDMLKEAVRLVVSFVICIVLYFVVNKIFLVCMNVELTDYKGISSMGKEPLTEYLRRAVYAFKEFLLPTVDSRNYMYRYSIRYVYFVFLAVGFVFAVLIVTDMFKNNKLKAVIATAAYVIFPLCVNFIFVMAGAEVAHSLMVYGQVTVFIAFAWMAERIKIEKKTLRSCISVMAAAMMAILILMFCRFDNKCYLRAVLTQSETTSNMTTLVTRIKSTEGYTDELPVAIVNENAFVDKSIFGPWELSDINLMPYYDVNSCTNDYTWRRYMWLWCGYNPQYVSADDFVNNPEVTEMPYYPDYGSIRVIDGTVVVKMGQE